MGGKTMKRAPIILTIYVILLLGIGVSGNLEAKPTEPKNTRGKIEEETFLEKRDAIIKDFEAEKKKLVKERTKLTTKIENRKSFPQLVSELAVLKVTLFSIKRFQGIETLLMIFFPITLMVSFLYIFFREREYFQKRKKLIISFFIIIIILFSLPAFAAEKDGEEFNFKRLSIEKKLDLVTKLMHMEDIDRAIFLLDKKMERKMKVKEIKVTKPYLRPWQIIDIEKPEYHYTLGCLYVEKGRKSDSIYQFKKAYQFDPKTYRGQNQKKYQEMLVGIARFFMEEGDLSEASNVLKEKAFPLMTEAKSLLDLAEFLYESMHDSALKALERAQEVAKKPEELFQIAEFYIKKGIKDKASSVLKKAIAWTKDRGLLFKITSLAIEEKMTDAEDMAIEKLEKITWSLDDVLKLADFLFEKKREERATNIIKDTIKYTINRAKIYSEKEFELLLKIANFCMEKKKYPLTISALERILLLNLGKHKKVDSPKILPASKNLLAPEEKITLPIYLGIFYQIKERLSDAMSGYEMAAGFDLDNVINKGGFEIKGNLNSFFYLKQLWEIKGLTENIEKLKPFYAFLKEDYLKRLEEIKKKLCLTNIEICPKVNTDCFFNPLAYSD